MSRTSEKRARRAEAQRRNESGNPLTGVLQNRNVWLYGGGGLLALVIVVAIVGAVMGGNQPAPAPTAVDGTPRPAPNEVVVPNMGGQHVRPGEPHAVYNSNPPTSGPHYETSVPWDSPSDRALPEELWIHNLEHSGVVALHNCPQGCPELISKLENFRKTGPRSKLGYVKLLITPYGKARAKLTLVAWNYYLELDDYDETAIRNFFLAHQDKGPEPNAP